MKTRHFASLFTRSKRQSICHCRICGSSWKVDVADLAQFLNDRHTISDAVQIRVAGSNIQVTVLAAPHVKYCEVRYYLVSTVLYLVILFKSHCLDRSLLIRDIAHQQAYAAQFSTCMLSFQVFFVHHIFISIMQHRKRKSRPRYASVG